MRDPSRYVKIIQETIDHSEFEMNMKQHLRLAAFACAAAATLWSIAAAQGSTEPLTVRPQIDERGVDLISQVVQLNGIGRISIGPDGEGGLTFAHLYRDGGWRFEQSGMIEDTGYGATVSLGSSADTFLTNPYGTLTNVPEHDGLNTFNFVNTSGTSSTLKYEYYYTSSPYNFSQRTWTYTDRTGATYIFSGELGPGLPLTLPIPRLVQITYPAGEVVNFNYKEVVIDGIKAVRLQSITNNLGYAIHLEYARNGAPLIGEVEEWQTLRKATGFDSTVVTNCAPLADICTIPASWPRVEFTGPYSRVDSMTDGLGQTSTFSHDTNGRLTAVRLPGTASPTNNFSYTYNADGTVDTVTANGAVWDYNSTTADNIRTLRVEGPTDNDVIVISNTLFGRIESVATGATGAPAAGGQITTYAYEPNGPYRLQRITAPEGNYSEFGYDTRSNIVSTTLVAKPGSGIPNIVTSATYPATCANPKTCNKPTSTTDALGKTTDFTYDGTHGGLLTVLAPAPATGGIRQQITYAYTSNAGVWRASTATTCATAQVCAGTANEAKITIAYGTHLLPSSISFGSGDGSLTASTSYSYTSAGDVATIDGPLPGTTDTTLYFYDASRRLIGNIGPDPDGAGPLKRRASRTTYVGNSSLVDFTDQGAVAGTDLAALGAMTSLLRTDIDYDSYGRPLKVRDIFDGLTQAVAQVSYDGAGRTDCIALRMNKDAFGSLPTSACVLGALGIFGNDRILKYAYDKFDRVISQTSAFGSPATVERIESTTYTPNGLVATLSDGKNNRTTYEYDGFDRLRRTLFPHPTTAGTSSSSDYEQLTYDSASRVTQRRLRDGQLIGLTYDFRSRLTGVDVPGTADDVTNTYDVLGRQLSSAIAGHTNSFAYDILGRLLSETSPQNGVNKTVNYQYDLAGRRTRVDYPADSGAAALWASYSYDVTGAMTQVRANSATVGTNVLATYAYNDLGQRVSITRGNGVTTNYAYADPARRLSQIVHDLDGAGTANDLTIDFTYSPASQIATRAASNNSYSWLGHFNEDVTDLLNGLNQPTMVGATSISHDARGNLTTDGTKIFTYDAQNRLISTADGASFKYDPLGRLYETLKSGTTTRFLYDGSEAIAEYSGAGALLRRYVRGAGLDEVVLWYEGTTLSDKRYLVADERGSVIAGTDGAGATLFKNVYDEYGRPGSANQGRFQYTGQMWLEEAGLYHYKARIYDPGLGRFLQTDPIGYADGLNLYAYVGGDPVNAIDPTGTEMFDLVPFQTTIPFGSCVHCGSSLGGLGSGNLTLVFAPGGFVGNFITNVSFNLPSSVGGSADEIVVTGARGDGGYLDGLSYIDLSGGLTGQDANYAYLGPLGPVIVATRLRPRSSNLFGIESSPTSPQSATPSSQFFGLDSCALRTAVVAGAVTIFAGDLGIILSRNFFGLAFRATAYALIGTELVIAGLAVAILVYIYDRQSGGAATRFFEGVLGKC
ncbi:MAG TPA: hypothetical protein DDZ68_16650 [Parvularcula sp.]|nr:hypothetical protein [Parvularcula sp.]